MDLPARLASVVHHRTAGCQVERDVVVQRVEVEEILLDHLALVAERDDELVDPVAPVDVHDVPQDRLAADLDHRLRLERRLLRQPRTQTAARMIVFTAV
jgi:hypothetical protein